MKTGIILIAFNNPDDDEADTMTAFSINSLRPSDTYMHQ